ncbi:Fic family protein [Gloeobacter kilaueensis]|nr:Fic family protein [Gloeobacter kilaueensis]
MLEEETRNSLSIEGIFTSEQNLQAVLSGRKSAPEVLNYYRTAESVYDQALQYYREEDFRLDTALVRHIHSSLFKEVTDRRGEFRHGAIRIQGAQVQPPDRDIDQYVRVYLELCRSSLKKQPLLAALARSHILFESIHPFDDGNGRVGRILLNYLAISGGCPPIVIKGITAEERTSYYRALEAADTGFHSGFPAPEVAELEMRLEQGNFGPIEALLCSGLLPRLDRLIAIAFERQSALQPLREVAEHFAVKEATLRKWIERGKLIALKRDNKLLSHPRLYLSDD